MKKIYMFLWISPGKKSDKDDEDPNKPIYVGEFPEVVRNEQANLLHKQLHGDAFNSGGIDKATSLAFNLLQIKGLLY